MSSIGESIQVERKGFRRNPFRELYYLVLTWSWPYFLFWVVVVWTTLNGLFAFLFMVGGDSIANATPYSFFDAFVFSNQTFATIGYGFLLPKGNYANSIVIVESLTGMIFTALVTGLTFAKFARPKIQTIFSNKALVVNFDGSPTLMFRIGNGRDTSIIDAKISVVTLIPHTTKEGIQLQRFTNLKLEREQSPFFLLSWTVMHKIDETSPFYGFTQDDFKKNKTELFISLFGFDEIFAQTVHVSHLYRSEDIIFAKKFVDVVSFKPDRTRIVDFNKFHDYVP